MGCLIGSIGLVSIGLLRIIKWALGAILVVVWFVLNRVAGILLGITLGIIFGASSLASAQVRSSIVTTVGNDRVRNGFLDWFFARTK